VKSIADAKCKQEIVRRIGSMRPDAPRQWGKMTAPQMICHLNDAFLGVMGERPIPILEKFRARKTIKWLALYFPRPWPPGVPTRPEIDQEFGGTKPAEFAADIRLLLELVERFTKEPRDFEFRPHPIFLEMTERQWMRWGYLHTDHHLRQFGA
jgi:hypothetical protein